jgi:hypothetical protein
MKRKTIQSSMKTEKERGRGGNRKRNRERERVELVGYPID